MKKGALITFLFIYTVLNFLIGWNGYFFLTAMGVSPHVVVYSVIFGFISFSYILARLKWIQSGVRRILKWIGSYYLALFEYGVLLFPIADLIIGILYFFGIALETSVPVVGWGMISILLVFFLIGSWNAWNPIIRKYSIQINKPNQHIRKLKLVAASDFHLGDVVGNKHLDRFVKLSNQLKPDVVLLPGDIIDDSVKPFIEHRMSEQLKNLQAKYGVFAVLGNHEYYGGEIKTYLKQMQEIGIKVLQDERVHLAENIHLVGRKDKAAESMDADGRLEIEQLLTEVKADDVVLMMDHQPLHLDKAEAAGVDVSLSGHTHRGQFFPNHWVTRRIFEIDWGYKLKNRMHVFVSSGFGTWGPPLRLGSRSEILQIEIYFKP